MGKRSAGETIAAIYQAFLRQRTWTQAELAREVGVSSETVHTRLEELSRWGMPLHDEFDPPHVYWSVPKDWFPGGVALSADRAVAVVRELHRAPRSTSRDAAISALLKGMVHDEAASRMGKAVRVPLRSDRDTEYMEIVEEALSSQSVLRMQYFTASRGDLAPRHVSPHELSTGPPARLVATCHRSGELKWFRLDNMWAATIDPKEGYRAASPQQVRRFVAESANGFHEPEPATEQAFFVRKPEAAWVRNNLIEPMVVEKETSDGIHVTARTAGAREVARFVVSLGGAAIPETDALRAMVTELAGGALRAAHRVAAVRGVEGGDGDEALNAGAVPAISRGR